MSSQEDAVNIKQVTLIKKSAESIDGDAHHHHHKKPHMRYEIAMKPSGKRKWILIGIATFVLIIAVIVVIVLATTTDVFSKSKTPHRPAEQRMQKNALRAPTESAEQTAPESASAPKVTFSNNVQTYHY